MQALATIPEDQFAAIQADPILMRIANGEMPTQVAATLGLCKAAISARYKGNPAYKSAQEFGTEIRLDDGLIAIRAAENDIDLARVREMELKRIEWRASVEHRSRWGQRVELTGAEGTALIPAQPADMARAVAFLLAKGGQDISDADIVKPERIAHETGGDPGAPSGSGMG